MTVNEITERLASLGDFENVAGMARYGIVTQKAFGVRAADLKQIAKELKKETTDRHSLAQELWKTGIHDCRALAYLVDDPKLVTKDQMDAWANDFDNWAITDGTCGHLFCRSPFADQKVAEWSKRDEEFVKRAGIVLIAWLSVHDKNAADEVIAEFLPILEREADDDRNFVKKAVNWSLRSIGKRSMFLNRIACETAERIKLHNTRSARWIAADALRELTSDTVIKRLETRSTVSKSKSGQI